MADYIAVPPELLERQPRAMEDAVVEARASRLASQTVLEEARAHHAREEPALAAHHDYLQQLAKSESQAAADAKARTEVAASSAAAARVEEEAARTRARAQTTEWILRILVPLVAAALGAGGMAYVAP